MSKTYDLIIIGAGPGGYVAAIFAAQKGLKTVVVEKDNPGGVCLNWGCIPSKNLIHQAEVFHSLSEMESVGVKIGRSGLDFKKVHDKSRQVVKTLTCGVASLLKKNNVDVIKGTAKITARGQVTVDNSEKVNGKNILVATGSRPLSLPGFEFDEEKVLSSTGILSLTKLPKSLVILGAGAIGCEFAFVMNSFGVNVTLVEYADHILPSEDQEVTAILHKSFTKSGIKILTKTKAVELNKSDKKVVVRLEGPDGGDHVEADKALVVFGRSPNTANLGLQEMGVKIDHRGFVETEDYYQTSAVGIYAIGDITKTPAFAHVASAEGEIAVKHIIGELNGHKKVDPELVPSAIYCEPQVAGFGLRESQIAEKGLKIKKSVFNYVGAGKTVAVGKTDGLVKVLCDAQTDEILGAHIVGHNATELVHELLLAKNAELLPEDIAEMIHAHPTISETILEVMKGVNGKPIHS